MASNTYASHYLQGWADANTGLYSPPGRILFHFLTNSASRYEIETRRVAYDEGYQDRRGEITPDSRTPPTPLSPH